MAYLVLVRHGESEWNAKSLWTGWTDVSLSRRGREQAKLAAGTISDINFNICFTSALKRSIQTWDEIKTIINKKNIPVISDKALNERDYGDLTGKNKWKVKEEYGDAQFQKWRRGWDTPPPNGESLKNVFDRVVPYYKSQILPHLTVGEDVIIVAHGNSLRALVKFLEEIPDNEIYGLDLKLGEPYIYQLESNGKIISKEIRSIGSEVG